MADNGIPESPGGTPLGFGGIIAVSAYLILVAFLVVHGLTVLWPPNHNVNVDRAEEGASTKETTESPRVLCPDQKEPVEFFWSSDLSLCITDEKRLFLIILLAGALGGLVHSLRSFYWYAGNRKLVTSWASMYITLPILGSTMAAVFYFVIRGGFFSPQSQVSDTSPFGFAAVGSLIGMFTEQAAMKLRQIAETFFAPAQKGKNDASSLPVIQGVMPQEGPQSGGTSVTLSGANFTAKTTVKFGSAAAAQVTFNSANSITAVSPAATAPGVVVVEITNPDGQKATSIQGFKYI